jgi:hypothetical protein
MPAAQPATNLQSQQPDRSRAWGAVYKAVNYSPYLNKNEKVVLNHLTMHLNVRDRGRGTRWAKIATICLATCLSRASVHRALKRLHEGGYILKEHRFSHGRKAPSNFAVTGRIFDEYKQALEERRARKPLGNGCLTVRPSQCLTVTHSIKTDPNEETKPKILGTECSTAVGGAQNLNIKKEAKEQQKPKRIGTRQEARRIIYGSLEWRPGEFIPYSAVDGLADHLLDKFGIEALRVLKNDLVEHNIFGCVKWNARKYVGWLEVIVTRNQDEAAQGE